MRGAGRCILCKIHNCTTAATSKTATVLLFLPLLLLLELPSTLPIPHTYYRCYYHNYCCYQYCYCHHYYWLASAGSGSQTRVTTETPAQQTRTSAKAPTTQEAACSIPTYRSSRIQAVPMKPPTLPRLRLFTVPAALTPLTHAHLCPPRQPLLHLRQLSDAFLSQVHMAVFVDDALTWAAQSARG